MHRIRRQVLDLQLPREASAIALQRQAGRVFQQEVLPKLDEIFSKIAPEGRIIRIERLEIDLGRLSEGGWERDFIERCVEQIARKVEEAVFDASLEPEAGVQVLSGEENDLDVFLFFLKTGALPWHARGTSLMTLESSIAEIVVSRPEQYRRALLPVLRQESRALTRLVRRFSPAFSEMLVEAVLGLSPGTIAHAVQPIQSRQGKRLGESGRITVFKVLCSQEAESMLRDFPLPDALARAFFEAQAGPAPLEALRENELPAESAVEAPAGNGEKDASRPGIQEKPVEPPPQKPQRPSQEPAAWQEQGLFVEQAGLVLLGVYLPAFFAELNLTTAEGRFADEEAQCRALHLLHYLAAGREHPEEPALVLPKLLCGMALEEPAPPDISLSEEEKTECLHLLEAAVRNWPALKNTGAGGFRDGFLLRTGCLLHRPERRAWLLRVERKGQDVLLERLPWTYGVVKLPWMEEMLEVEW